MGQTATDDAGELWDGVEQIGDGAVAGRFKRNHKLAARIAGVDFGAGKTLEAGAHPSEILRPDVNNQPSNMNAARVLGPARRLKIQSQKAPPGRIDFRAHSIESDLMIVG
jgi:hypothetical protein